MKLYLPAFLFLFSVHLSSEYKFETVLDNLDDAWSFVFLSEDKVLFTEMPGKLKIASLKDKSITNVTNIPEVAYSSQGGLSEVVLDPDFNSNNKIYMSYSANTDNNKITLFLSTAELVNDKLVNSKVIFKAVASRRSPAHMGAKISFLDDGTLILTSGDGYDHREKAQKLDNHFGKIIRINTDGSIPQDNPFISNQNALPEIYSYGHRNMQGLLVTSDGLIYEHEHGPKGGDELNIIKPALNYGWPAITYGIDYSGAVISPFTQKDGMEQPLLYWDPSIAPSDMIYYEKDLYPEFKNTFLITALVSRDVKQVVFENNEIRQKSLFSDLGFRLRNIQDSPNGYIYILTDGPGNKLIKVIPKKMKIAKYPFAVFSAALFTVMLITPISSISNLLWLNSVDMPVGIISSLEVLLFDFQRLGILLYGVVIIGFAIAFSFTAVLINFTNISSKYLYALAGAVSIGAAMYLMVELLFESELLGGNRTFVGKVLHWIAGFFGGYFYYSLISKNKNYTFIVRFFGILYAYLILGFVLNWVFTPESAAADYGFVLKDLNDNAQNALIRDFTSFFISTFIFTILGVITLNPTWFLAAGIIYYGAAVFNLYAIFIHGTNYNQIYIGEIILGSWPTIIAFAILYFKKNE